MRCACWLNVAVVMVVVFCKLLAFMLLIFYIQLSEFNNGVEGYLQAD